MFTFPIASVPELIQRGIAAAAANGGFRNPYYGLRPGKGEEAGLWLVGDEGVYLLSNGKLAEGQKAMVVYPLECDPSTNPDYWHYKHRHFGGDDGIEYLAAGGVLRLLDVNPNATHLTIHLTETRISMVPSRLPFRP